MMQAELILFYGRSYMDVHHSHASCSPDDVVPEASGEFVSESETNNEPVHAQIEVYINKVLQMRGEDRTPFE